MSEKKPTRTIELTAEIAAPLEKVWKALTEGTGPIASVLFG